MRFRPVTTALKTVSPLAAKYTAMPSPKAASGGGCQRACLGACARACCACRSRPRAITRKTASKFRQALWAFNRAMLLQYRQVCVYVYVC